MTDVSAFSNRLVKNFKHYAKWARRQGTEAWRVYDRDVPQFPFAVDVYRDWLHIAEYDTGWQMEDAEYDVWIEAVLAAAASVCQIVPDHVSLKTRRRQKGENQYEKIGELGDDFVV